MLKLYPLPISFNSRRVWVALLEKGLEFELVPMKLDGDQFQADFLALNPFHHIPVLVDGDFTVAVWEGWLGTGSYFGGDRLTLADIVAGTAVPLLPSLGVSLAAYPHLQDWTQRLRQRSSWQQTEATAEEVEAFKSAMRELMARRSQSN